MINGKSNSDILSLMDKKVIGHTEAKKALVALVNRSKMRHHQKYLGLVPQSELIDKHNILLIGDSGTGKTLLVETLQELVEFPLIKIDATHLAPTSAKSGIEPRAIKNEIGYNARQLLRDKPNLYFSEEGTIDQTIVFIDEVDKLARDSNAEGWNKHVQSSFLTVFESYEELKNVCFIFAGAFVGLDNHNIRSSKPIGFTNQYNNHPTDRNVDEAVIKYGLIPEIVGRINRIVELDKFTEENYRTILLNTLIPLKQKELEYFNINYNFNDHPEEIDRIINVAFNSGQGVRALKRELNRVVAEVEFLYEENSNYCNI